jgi:endonuclease/exonuclease/phosphatase family metal-dependent hydrolase
MRRQRSPHRRPLPGIFAAVLLALLLPAAAGAAEVRVITWNVEDTGADVRITAALLRQLARQEFDLWGLCEVQPASFDVYLAAVNSGAQEAGLEASYQAVQGASGGARRLLLLVNASRLEWLEGFALSGLQFGGGGRAPLCVRVRERETGRQFLFSVSHFHRTDEVKRREQAIGFREYAAAQTLPMIAVGDFNFDVDIPFGRGNEAFHLFTEGGALQWVKPRTLVATNWSDGKHDPDGLNDYNSVLDFVFVAGDARQWKAESHVIVRAGDFPDTPQTSDHRPVAARIEIPDLERSP